MRRNTPLFFILFILLLAAVYFFFFHSSGSFRKSDKQFSVADTSLIQQVEITGEDGSVSLQRQDGQWKVNGRFFARDRLIKSLLVTLHRLQPDVPVSRKKHDEILRQLRDHSKKVKITQEGKPAKVYYAWHDSLDTGVTYMVLEGSDQPFRMHLPGLSVTDLYSLYRTGENFWRDNILFSLGPGQISAIEVRHYDRPDASFRIEKADGEEWRLISLSGNKIIENYSRDNLMYYLYHFINVRFDEILSPGEGTGPEVLGGQEASTVITMMEADGTNTVVSCYPRYISKDSGERVMDMNRLYLQVNDSEEVLLARYIQIDLILKDLSYFILI